MNNFKQIAIIGSTASGKTALAIKVAKKMDACILSLDSLSIYKEINIVSAKPTKEEQKGILHFGINFILPNENFDVTTFIELYHEVYTYCIKNKKNLVIVGGTSFYLKILIEGISSLPKISLTTKYKTQIALKNLTISYKSLHTLDAKYMNKIKPQDNYRIEKSLNIYYETGLIPTEYFKLNPPIITITEPLPIYQIIWERALLRERISLRTVIMVKDGLIDEVCRLEKKYTRKPNCMKSIGIKETFAYLDGAYDKQMLIEKITTNTSRLAKRQNTFNNSQFKNVIKGSVEALESLLL